MSRSAAVRRARRAAPAAAALAGAVLVLSSWRGDAPADGDVRAALAAPAAAPAPTAPLLPVPADPLPAGTGPTPSAPAPSAAPPPVPPPVPLPLPVAVVVDALGLDADVVPVGVRGDGALDVPADGDDVGWYRWGPVPGAPGSAVLAGHVDTYADGPGALFDLARAGRGDVVRIRYADGSERRFGITARESFPKDRLPAADLFRRTGPARLVLVTCGGDWDAAQRTYSDNVVVVAEPLG
ncbi:hypothetical protein NUM3379_15720 [Kineococcus sp. NUM-3379]